MRIRQLYVSTFGYLEDRKLDDLPSGLVVVLGENETGKSTLFALLSALLYGFHPVSDYPYRPWHADAYPEFKALLELSDGSEAEIVRKLMSTPHAVLTLGGSTQELGNRNLPFADHVGKDLYQALYALTPANLRSLDEVQREEIEDRLLSGLGTEVLRPTREVITELEERAGSLWRSTGRGKPRYRNLRETLQEAKRQRSAAGQADANMRDKVARLECVGARIDELVKDKIKLSVDIKRADILLPLRERMQQIEEWRSSIDNMVVVKNLPEGLQTEYRRLCQNVQNARERVDDLVGDRKKLVKRQEIFTPDDERITEYSDRIEGWLKRMSAHQQDRVMINDLVQKENGLQVTAIDTAETVLTLPRDKVRLDTLESVVLPDLRVRIASFQKQQKEVDRRATEVLGVGMIRIAGPLPWWVPACVGGCAAVMFVVGGVLKSTPLVSAGVCLLLAAAAAVGINLYLKHQRNLLDEQQAADRGKYRELQNQEEMKRDRAHEGVAEALGGLPVVEALIEKPDEELYQAIAKLQSIRSEFLRLRKDREEREGKWEEQQKDLAGLMAELGHASATPEMLSHVEEHLREARSHRRTWDESAERIQQIDEAFPDENERFEEAEKEMQQFLEQLKAAVGEELTPDQLLQRASELQKLADRILNVKQGLELEHPDLSILIREIGELEQAPQDAWLLNAVEVEKHRDQLQDVERELGDLREEKGRLKTEVDTAHSQISVGELDGQIERIQEQMEDVCCERDRLVFMSCLLREADRRFREKHQPDILKRAGSYLETATGGRYSSLLTMADVDGKERLAVMTGSGEHRWVEPPLSGGTLDQVLLCFRLAVIDHLDEGREVLPLLLDEALINWDDKRLKRCGDILQEATKRRQVFLFTCHQWVADKLHLVTDAPVLELPVS